MAVVVISRELDHIKSAQFGCRKCSPSNTKEPEKRVQNFGSAVTKTELFFCEV